MPATRVKSFSVTDYTDLDLVDSWWAGLLKKGTKEIVSVEWIAQGDLVWDLRIAWAPLKDQNLPFKVCMPAYAQFTIEDLEDILESVKAEHSAITKNLNLFKAKVDDWGIIERNPTSDDGVDFSEYPLDPFLSYASKLDVVEKIIASEFLWPSYKSHKKAQLMCEARINEIQKEISHRNDSRYTIVRVDRGMLRKSFRDQMGYDNQWLFASEEELMDDAE